MRNVFTIISMAAVATINFNASAADPDYVVVAAEHQNIESNPQYMDLRPDDVTRHLYLWENTVVGETLTDSPYEGNEYTRLTVNSGWFGLGFISDAPLDLSVFQRKEMVLHFALRTTATCPLQVRLEGGAYPGTATINLTGLYDVPRDGEWHVVEIPVSAFQAAGLVWGSYVKSKNYFSLVSEGSASGQVIDLDYIYFHSGTREDGTVWEGLQLGEVSGDNPSSYLIASEHTGIEGNPAYVDLRPDDVTRHLYIWDDTAADYPDSDLEAYEGSQFSCLHITNGTWFGFGIISDVATDMSAMYEQPYYLRFAVATTSLMPLFVKLEGNNNTSAVVYLQGKYHFRRDGQWHVVQIPMTEFLNQGLDWHEPIAGKNYFSIVSEKATKDYLLSFDAVTIEAGEPQPVEEERPEVNVDELPDYVLVASEEGVVPVGEDFLDLRPNGTDINLYVWENTAVENAPVVGEAFEGADYSSLQVQSSWFGFGIMNSAPKDFTCFEYKDYNFHIALRTTSEMPIQLRFEGLGQGVYDIDAENLPRDGEWHEIEFPVSDLFAQGLVWEGSQEGKNYFSLVSETAEQGAIVDFDAIYFYATGEKGDAGVAENAAYGEFPLYYSNGTLHAGGYGFVQVYSVSGQLVYNGAGGEIPVGGLGRGMYIARQDGKTVKFIVE